MTNEEFCFKKELDLARKKFISDGWITLYSHSCYLENKVSLTVFSYLVTNETVCDKCMTDYCWDISMGSGRIAVYGDNSYFSFAKEGIEPIIYVKEFKTNGNYIRYNDISEELICYFNLLENCNNKQNRKYLFIDDNGDTDEVIIVTEEKVSMKLKYLQEYLAIRKINLIICFDFVCQLNSDLCTFDIEYKDDVKNENDLVYNAQIRCLMNDYHSLVIGKSLLKHGNIKTIGCHYDIKKQYENFIVGYDEVGNEALLTCERTAENYFKLTYFKKEVLDKYYNNPSLYKVDGFSISSDYFSLKIDNNNENYVAVFLVELSCLPYKEQKYWKSFNVLPQSGMGISKSYYRTMIEGNWTENNEALDLYFKDLYEEFDRLWSDKFGWTLFKPLNKEQKYVFASLHLLPNNEAKSFCELVQSMALLLIDCINDEITKNIELDPGDRGIIKLKKFFASHHLTVSPLIEYFKYLQDLRSCITPAHRFSESNKTAKKAIRYFGLNLDFSNAKEVGNEIFVKSIYTLNTLIKAFSLK